MVRLSRSEEGQGETFSGQRIRNVPGEVTDCLKPRDVGPNVEERACSKKIRQGKRK